MFRFDRLSQPAMLAAFFAAGAMSVLGYSWLTRSPSRPTESRLALATPAPVQSQETIEPPPLSAVVMPEPEVSEPPSSVDNVSQWVADVGAPDEDKRAAAIVALATAPKAQALPALTRALDSADSEGQQLALSALRTLAQTQGDADGRIRDVVRKVLYHDSDAGLTTSAQDTLEDIESDLSQEPEEDSEP
jgi:hypothetical protein